MLCLVIQTPPLLNKIKRIKELKCRKKKDEKNVSMFLFESNKLVNEFTEEFLSHPNFYPPATKKTLFFIALQPTFRKKNELKGQLFIQWCSRHEINYEYRVNRNFKRDKMFCLYSISEMFLLIYFVSASSPMSWWSGQCSFRLWAFFVCFWCEIYCYEKTSSQKEAPS